MMFPWQQLILFVLSVHDTEQKLWEKRLWELIWLIALQGSVKLGKKGLCLSRDEKCVWEGQEMCVVNSSDGDNKCVL